MFKMSKTKESNPSIHAMCGGVAGLISRFVISPLDVIKIRLQVQRSQSKLWDTEKIKLKPIKYKGIIGTFQTIYKEEGIRAFWKGNWSASYLYVFYGASQFFFYNKIETSINKLSIHDKNLTYFLSGSSAGFLATFLTYPFDLLRTRFALQVKESNNNYKSIYHAIKKIYKLEGIKGYYHGLNPALLQIFPYMGLMFFTYEVSNQKLKETIPKDSIFYNSSHSIAGSIAGFISKIIVFPMDVLRKRLQVVISTKTNPTNTPRKLSKLIKNMLRHEGITAFYKGLLPGLLKSIPTSAVTFGVYGLCLKCLE
ncbi:mitochondrial thiamine pyrophosphate carrier [Neoconidiobolus thromboides FSU 785]|nr:mitochondrial thiamine pyrophosphate carrier [Neoconidiobolus thromboides FSU 785]